MFVRFAATALVVLRLSTAMAATPAQRCSQGKLARASRKAESKLKCEATGAKLGSVRPFCLETASLKFTKGWNNIEARGGCLTTNDLDVIEAKVDAFVDDITTDLWPSMTVNRCASLKLRAAARKTRGKLVCHAKAAKKSVAIDPLCLSRVDANFAQAWAKAESVPPCLTTGDEAAIEAKIDAFVNEIAFLLPAPSTTTSSTSTSTTVTTETTMETSTTSSTETSTTVESSTSSSTTSSTSTTSTTIPASPSAAFL